jgi:hypothetical protein
LHHENISRHMGILLRDANHLWPIGPKCLQSVPATKPPRR